MVAAFQAGSRAQWWSIGVTVLQLVASWQLIRMRPNHKLVVTVWGVVAALIAVYIHYPVLEAMSHDGINGAFGGGTAMLGNLSFVSVAIALITPVATLILVHRKQRELPTAVLQR
jgi:multisubunit Na+/H+ antiporter MnhG subunit